MQVWQRWKNPPQTEKLETGQNFAENRNIHSDNRIQRGLQVGHLKGLLIGPVRLIAGRQILGFLLPVKEWFPVAGWEQDRQY